MSELAQLEAKAIDLIRHFFGIAEAIQPTGYWVGFSGGKDSVGNRLGEGNF